MAGGLAAAEGGEAPPPPNPPSLRSRGITCGGCVNIQSGANIPSIQSDCSSCLPGPGPIAALVAADVIMTLLIAGGAYCLGGRGRRGAVKPRPPEVEPTYQELQGARVDVYSELKRSPRPMPIPHQRLSAPSPK
ncbi:TYRO protein tyrosine kinase-binding protein isoform 2-T2 [Amazona ochrocephala]